MNIDRDEELEQETVDAAEQAASELQAQASALSRENVDAVLSQFLPNQNTQVDATAVLNEIDMFARRIELINLYRALLNQPLFGEGGDEALKAGVEKEVRGFVVSRLKDLLGIAKPVAPAPQQVASPFSDDETQALKMIASKITGKAPSVSAAPKSVAPRINPVNINGGVTVSEAPVPPELIATAAKPKATAVAKKKDDGRAPIVDPLTGQKKPNPKNVGQVGQMANSGSMPKPLPMPNPSQEVAKVISEITNSRPVTGSSGESTALSLAIAKAIHNAQSREE